MLVKIFVSLTAVGPRSLVFHPTPLALWLYIIELFACWKINVFYLLISQKTHLVFLYPLLHPVR